MWAPVQPVATLGNLAVQSLDGNGAPVIAKYSQRVGEIPDQVVCHPYPLRRFSAAPGSEPSPRASCSDTKRSRKRAESSPPALMYWPMPSYQIDTGPAPSRPHKVPRAVSTLV